MMIERCVESSSLLKPAAAAVGVGGRSFTPSLEDEKKRRRRRWLASERCGEAGAICHVPRSTRRDKAPAGLRLSMLRAALIQGA